MRFTASTIGEIASVQTGPFGSQLHNEDYVLVGTPIVTVEHLGQRKMTRQNLPCVTDADKERLSKYTLKYGDLVFSRVGSVDRCSWVSDDEDGWMFSGRCLRVRPLDNKAVYHKYLYYFFNLEDTKGFVRNIAVGATMPSINTRLLSEVPIQIPSVEDQRAIADTLSALDDKIEKNHAINYHLEQMAQAIWSERFGGCEPNGTLGDYFPVKTGKKDANVAKGGAYPFFSCSQNILYTDRYSFDAKAILLAGNGDFNVKVYSGKFEAYQRTYVLIPNDEQHLGFLYYAIKQCLVELTAGFRGSVIRFITKGNIENFQVFVPKDTVIFDFFNGIVEKIAHNSAESARLATLRDTLLPRLMSGELSVADVNAK